LTLNGSDPNNQVLGDFKDNEKYIEVYLDRQEATYWEGYGSLKIDIDRLDWKNQITWYVNVEGGPDENVLIDRIEYVIDSDPDVKQKARFILNPNQIIFYKLNKKLKIQYQK
jgi:hypothetical protein